MFEIFHSGYYVASKFREETQNRIVEYYEIELYTDSSGFTYLNGEKLRTKKHDVLIAKPNDVRRSEGGYSCHSLKFVCTDLEYKKRLDGMHGIHGTSVANKLIPIFSDLYKAFLLKREFECDALIRMICASLYYPKTYSGKYVQYLDSVDKVVEYVCDNIGQKLLLKDLGALVNLSPSFLHKVFRDVIGITIGEFVLTLRIDKAKELLSFMELSVDKIAFDCGFSSRAYFDNTFKKRVGITPVEYRKSIQ
jgi:AraC-like DNA-binding protein